MSKLAIIFVAFTRLLAGCLDTVTYPGYTGPAPVYNTATGAWDNVSGKDSLRYASYDLDGNVTRRVDGRGTITNYIYADPENRLTDIQYPATTSLNVHFNYDAFGRRGNTTSGSPGMTDSTGSAAYAYDDDDDLTSVVTTYTGLPAQTVSYQYYPDAARRTMTTPAGTFTYAYDNDGRVKSVTNPASEASAWTFQDNGWLKTQTLGNGVATTYTPNPLGLLTDLVNKTSGGTTLSDFGTVKYDGVGDRTQTTISVPGATAYGGTTTDTYDYGQTANPLLNRSQVTSEVTTRNGGGTGTFSYDGGIGTGAGNPTTFPGKIFTYNADNQITSTGYLYDGAGNATTFGATAITYDAEDRLTSYGGSTLSAGYTGDDLRAWKQNSAGVRTYFLYDGASPVCELSSTGSVTATNTWGRNGLLSRRVGSTSSFYTFDLSGNTAQTLSSTGSVTLTAAVSAFGQRTASGATIDPYSGMGGQWGCYNDPESGLFLMGHRYYSSSAGKFLTRDPMGYAGGVNLYAYCGNDPVNESDPSGLAGMPNGDGWNTAASFFGGFGSTASFGLTDVINGWTGASAVVDKCSVAYGAGAITGTVVQSLAFGGAGAAADEAAEGAQAAERAAREAEEATCGGGGCFIAGTPVEMGDGSTKAIEDVHVGDVVKSRDPDTGKDVDEQVVSTFMHPVQTLVTVTAMDTAKGQTETLTCTAVHPFFVQGRGFVAAGDLTAGMVLSSGLHGCLSVTEVEWQKASVVSVPGLVSDGTPVYNFTVAYTHTYFVGSLNGGTWVHNDCDWLPGERSNESAADAADAFQRDLIRKARDLARSDRNGIKRVDVPNNNNLFEPGRLPHVEGDGWSVNIDGTWHDAGTKVNPIPGRDIEALQSIGWPLPQ